MLQNDELLWQPNPEELEKSRLKQYRKHLKNKYQLEFGEYHDLWEWSVQNIELFWKSLFDFFEINYSGDNSKALDHTGMPGTKWFENVQLNYAENIFKNRTKDHPALIFKSEFGSIYFYRWLEFSEYVSQTQIILKRYNLKAGDRVAGFLPNIPETTFAFLASCALGYTWSACSPDFGTASVIDRFKQIEPKILFAVDGYSYNGKKYDKRQTVAEIVAQLPSVEVVIWIPYEDFEINAIPNVANINWSNEIEQIEPGEIEFIKVPFDHPIWILYSSGTTGLPKAITHGHGGMLLEHLKYLCLQNDVKRGERYFWYSTTGWMMWNFVHASLLAGATAVLYDGSPAYPNLEVLWEYANDIKLTHFGTSAPFLIACMKENLDIKNKFPLIHLRSIGSTGSPLPPEAFEYVFDKIKERVWLCSMSGGTDVCTAFVGSCIERKVYRGEIQCRALGVSLESWNDIGQAVNNEMGEMVITKPMPCMPIYFWNDPSFEKYTNSYFDIYPGIWRHGDWVEITHHDGIKIYGRSDATLNRHGIRIGTAEIYNVLLKIESLQDALIVNIEKDNGEHFMPLFIQMKAGEIFSDQIKNQINDKLKKECSPRHIPDIIIEAPEIPYTISGKKMESPVKKILMKMDTTKAYNVDAMRNPHSMEFFKNFKM